jgi:transketolase
MAMTYEDMLVDLVRKDDRVMILTAENRAAIRTIPERIGERFIDVGIAEQTMVGIAAGLALRGRIPIVHALATFLTMRAFEFIRTDVGIRQLPVKLIGAVPGFLSEANGPTHQALEDLGLLRGIPSMRVFCPADLDDLVMSMPSIVRDPHPWYVRFPVGQGIQDHEPFVIGRAEVYGEGSDVAILTYGFLLREAQEAAARLRGQGYGVRVIHLRTIKPLDYEIVLHCAKECRRLVVVEDHFRTGGLTSAVSELLTECAVAVPMMSLSFRERWFQPGRLREVLENEGFSGRRIADRIAGELHGSDQWIEMPAADVRNVVPIL